MTKINLLEGFLKGKTRSHMALYKVARYWAGKDKPSKCRESKENSSARSRATRARNKAEVIAAYGGHCGKCPEADPACLTIDHIHDDGAAERRRGIASGADLYSWLRQWGFPKDRYQLLCMNCQWKKRAYGTGAA